MRWGNWTTFDFRLETLDDGFPNLLGLAAEDD